VVNENLLAQHLQDAIAYLCICSKRFLSLARPSIKLHYFSSPITANIADICFKFYDSFNEPPNQHLYDELIDQAKHVRDEEKPLYREYITKLLEMDKPNEDYIISKLSNFIRAKELELASEDFKGLIQDGKFTEAELLMHDALQSGIRENDIGIVYFDKPTMRENKKILFNTKIETLDRLIKGFHRKQFICLLGSMKGGKSWGCIHLGKAALLQGLNVLHISHEMTDDEVEARYDMAFGALTDEDEPQIVEITLWDSETNRFKTIKEKRDTIYNLKETEKVRNKAKRFGGKLIIKKYPMFSATMFDVQKYIDYLENYENFEIDLLINDYADIMLPLNPKEEKRHQLNDIYMFHKRLADERNMVVLTVSQCNRQSIRKPILSMKDFAEDIRKVANVDLGIAICQTEQQVMAQQATLYVVANRAGKQDVACIIGQNFSIGQWALWDRPYYKITKEKENGT